MTKKLYSNLLFLLFLFFGVICCAQKYNLTNTFSTKDGLPSNLVYEVVQDDHGFLWLATDNGISRFDGKRFINYSTKNGLPSNDVIHVIKQNNGTIWADCYKQPPSYFDEKLNRFVCLDDKEVQEISNSLFRDIYSVHKNDLFFQNYLGSFMISNGKIINKIKSEGSLLQNKANRIYLKDELITVIAQEHIDRGQKSNTTNFYGKNGLLGKIDFQNDDWPILQFYDNQSIYRFYEKKLVQVKINNLSPFKYKLQTSQVPETIKWFKFSADRLAVISTTGSIFIYDEKSLQLLSTIKNESNVNTAYIDDQNNVWVATVNNGLMYYTTQTIKKEQYSKEVITNFLCAKMSEDGSLYAGNFQGEIYVKKGKSEKKYNFAHSRNNNIWIRNIHFFPEKNIAVSDKGILVNENRKINFYNDVQQIINLKSSMKLNENELILGSIQGLVKYNVNSEKYEILNFSKERILNLKKIDDHSFYFSANKGLYRYNLISNRYHLILSNDFFKNDKIQHVEPISPTKIWISTYKGNLYLVENSKIIKEFINDDRMPINISKLLNLGNQLWIASKSGIIILDYVDLDKIIITKLTTSDGLTSNVINDLCLKKDTIYAATDFGVCKIPFPNIQIQNEIKPKIIAIKINEKTVAPGNRYLLESNQNNISIELAGVDLTGHFKNFKYSINENKAADLEGNFLNLQLNSGLNTIIIKVVDENNKAYTNGIKLIFEIKTPFYKTIWFWIILSTLISAFIFYMLNRRKFLKQKRIYQQKLEMQNQRQKITADLHDDLGASLSSLQINSAVAQKLFEKNPTETRKLLEKIESQAKSISENIGDIIWSLKPSKDEFMSLSTRIRKIISEILGSSDIHYELLIDASIDAEIIDFSVRKNLILICKESLNNILKHSQAKEVCVVLQKTKDSYILKIEDDGIGFSDEKRKGNGIINMKRRVEELGGNIIISSDAGTSLVINIPRFRD